ncbi:hypothetical protein MIMGU_mgv1a0242622mg, partial [Erythranthe guttata]
LWFLTQKVSMNKTFLISSYMKEETRNDSKDILTACCHEFLAN